MKKPRKTYESLKVVKGRFDIEAEKFTARFGILIGLDRLLGYVDTKGVNWPAAWSLHVDGLCFRCESVQCAIAFLQGVTAGFEFSASGPVRFVTKLEVEDMIKQAMKGLTNG